MEIRPITFDGWLKMQPKIREIDWCLDEKCPNNPWYGVKSGAKIRIKLPKKG